MKMPDRETMKALILKEPEGEFSTGRWPWRVQDGCEWHESDRGESGQFDRRLIQYGYAPGGYIIHCWDCKAQSWECDKRALRCKECAEKRLNDSLAMYQGMD